MSNRLPAPVRVAARVLALVGFAVAGAVTGIAGVLVSREEMRVLGVPFPYGLILALVATIAVFDLAAKLLGRAGGLAATLAWGVVVAAALVPRAAGDFLIAGDWYGAGFVLVCVAAAAWTVGRAGPSHRPVPPHEG